MQEKQLEKYNDGKMEINITWRKIFMEKTSNQLKKIQV